MLPHISLILAFHAFILITEKCECKAQVPQVLLNNGKRMPVVGLGTYLGWVHGPNDKDILQASIEAAIDMGYRHIDTASVYETEEIVGLAIRKKIFEGVVKREDLFITTKLVNECHDLDHVENAVKVSLDKLQLKYVDLYLMHFPMGYYKNGTINPIDYVETWRAIEDVQRKGLAASIGISNFNISQIARLLEHAVVKPAVLQTEVHLSLSEKALVSFAQEKGLAVTAYSPLGQLPYNTTDLKRDPLLNELATKYNKSVVQIALKYLLERGIVIIPKSLSVSRQRSNIDLFDFHLTTDEMDQLGGYNKNARLVLPDFFQDHPYYPFEHSGRTAPRFPVEGRPEGSPISVATN